MSKYLSKFAFLAALILALALAACAPQPAAPAPTQAPAPTEAAAASGGAVSFANDVLPIFKGSCVGCHGGSAGLALSSYDSLMAGSANGAVINPGDAAGSRLFVKVQSGQMPRGGSKLSDAKLQTIRDWIDAGAQNN